MGRLKLPLEQNFDYMVANRTMETLKRLDDRPFMLTCSFNLPHDPNVVPSPYYEMFNPDEIVLPDNFGIREERFESQWSRQVVANLGEVGVREFRRIYYASVKLIDDQVGRVLDTLDAIGRADNTIVLFTADHGDMCGGHGMVWKSTDAFYEEVARIPFIIRYPQEIVPQQLDIVSNIADVMPTLLDFVGHPIPGHVEGNNLAPFLRGEKRPEEAPRYTFCERLAPLPEHRRDIEPGRRGSFMIRSCDWKYCRYADGEEMLYNLTEDAGETKNLVSDPRYQQIREELRKQLHEVKE
jgi:arylsulfatase A-like enzyme